MPNISESSAPHRKAGFLLHNRILSAFLLLLLTGLPALRAGTNSKTLPDSAMTNLSAFTGSYLKLPAPDLIFPEVQTALQTDPFRDVYEDTGETPWRRMEIVALISFPPLFFLGNVIVRLVHMVRTESPVFDMLAPLPATENIILYSSTILASGALAVNDYRLTRRKKAAREIEWTLWKKKF